MQSIEEINTKTHTSTQAWLIWLASAVFVVFQFFLQLSGGVIVNDLMHSFTINALGAGILSSTYYYVYVSLQTPAGMLIDRYGPRRLLTVGAIVCAIGCWLFASSAHVMPAEIGRILMGGGSAFAFVGSLFLISQWFAIEKFGFMVGIAETLGTMGTIAGNIYLAQVLNQFGWRSTMLGAAGVALLISALCWLIIRDRPKIPLQAEKIAPDESHFLQHVMALFKSKTAWLNGIYCGLIFSVVTVFVALWGIPFLIKAYQMSLTMATIVSSFLFLGLALGCPLVGISWPKIKHRKLALSLAAFLMAILLTLVIWHTQLPLVALFICMLLLGLMSSIYVINYTIAKEIAPPEAISTSIGFTNTLAVITAPLFQPLVGAILHHVHELNTANQLDQYTVFDFQIALMVLPVALMIAAVIAWFINAESLNS